jgi:hypothetical protein
MALQAMAMPAAATAASAQGCMGIRGAAGAQAWQVLHCLLRLLLMLADQAWSWGYRTWPLLLLLHRAMLGTCDRCLEHYMP